MAADTVKSLQITNLDATPIQAATTGQGASARLFQLDDYVAATATGIVPPDLAASSAATPEEAKGGERGRPLPWGAFLGVCGAFGAVVAISSARK